MQSIRDRDQEWGRVQDTTSDRDHEWGTVHKKRLASRPKSDDDQGIDRTDHCEPNPVTAATSGSNPDAAWGIVHRKKHKEQPKLRGDLPARTSNITDTDGVEKSSGSNPDAAWGTVHRKQHKEQPKLRGDLPAGTSNITATDGVENSTDILLEIMAMADVGYESDKFSEEHNRDVDDPSSDYGDTQDISEVESGMAKLSLAGLDAASRRATKGTSGSLGLPVDISDDPQAKEARSAINNNNHKLISLATESSRSERNPQKGKSVAPSFDVEDLQKDNDVDVLFDAEDPEQDEDPQENEDDDLWVDVSLPSSSGMTAKYGHEEPYNQLKVRVREFMKELTVPLDSSESKLKIQRMHGGAHNRIVGLSFRSSFILRLPRFPERSYVGSEVAVLKLIEQKHPTIPAPRVVLFDETADNTLKLPFAIHKRIEGENAYMVYPLLRHEQKLRFAKEFGKICSEMLKIQSVQYGRVVPSMLCKRSSDVVSTESFEVYIRADGAMQPFDTKTPPKRSFSELLVSIFEVCGAIEAGTKQNETQARTLTFYEDLVQMTLDLKEQGYLDFDRYSLAHVDLVPHNIIINPHGHQNSLITGILDWDGAMMAPQLLSCTPPSWIWGWTKEGREREYAPESTREPMTAQQAELKTAFERAAGGAFMKYTYDPKSRLARGLIRFASARADKGFKWSREEYRKICKVLDEWFGGVRDSTAGPAWRIDDIFDE